MLQLKRLRRSSGQLGLVLCGCLAFAPETTRAEEAPMPSYDVVGQSGVEAGFPEVESLFPETYFPQLEVLLAHAVEQAPEVIAELLEVERQAQLAEASRSARLPSASLYARLNYREDIRDNEPRRQNSFSPISSFTVEQPLYRWGAIDAQIQNGLLGQHIASENLAAARRSLVLTVRSEFLTLILLEEEKALLAGRLDAQRKTAEARALQFEQGKLTELEQEETAILLEERELEMAELEIRIAASIRRLKNLSGWEGPLFVERPDASAGISQLESKLTALQLESAVPENSTAERARVFRTQHAMEENEYTIIRARTRPQLNVGFRSFIDQVASVNADSTNRFVAEVFFGVSWNIFDGYESKFRKLASLTRQRQLTEQANDALADHLNYFRDLQERREIALKRVRLLERRIRLNERQSEQIEADFESDRLTATARNDFYTNLGYSRLDFLYEQLNLILLTTEMLSEMGRDPLAPAPAPSVSMP